MLIIHTIYTIYTIYTLNVYYIIGDVTDHAAACVEASLQMHEYLHTLTYSEEWKEKGYPIIKIRCGIHSANVFVGNLGAPDRMKYGIMGDGVNLASRLEELNKKYTTRILISEHAFHQGENEEDIKKNENNENEEDEVYKSRFRICDNYITRQLDNVQVKGRTSGTGIYEVLGRKMPITRPIPIKIYHPDEFEEDSSVGDIWRDKVQAQHLENFNRVNEQNINFSMKLNKTNDIDNDIDVDITNPNNNSNHNPNPNINNINSLHIKLAKC